MREEWEHKGVYVNFWEADPLLIALPWGLKTEWLFALKPLVEEWIGGEALEKTDIYGFRVYQEGARLLKHVDREETHAASLIINVAQANVTKDWPIQIHDVKTGAEHSVFMEPGDIVYYESAMCLHGRME